ncbi:hypothetical protein PHET_10651 [Paragonimus heterotremus]|uniref:Uncharacterized protein n=1 Tax=Paragonimus heterotremus TaxID=100268 RepID=A0A8J4T217_9TREM|nr:hypothetical protein PHET_10651 [Paragonimus heterotremus]
MYTVKMSVFVALVAVVYALPPRNVSPHFSVGPNDGNPVIDDNELKKDLLIAVLLEKAAQDAAAESDLLFSKAKTVLAHAMEEMMSSTINTNLPQPLTNKRIYRGQMNIEYPKSQKARLSDPLLESDELFSRPVFSPVESGSHSKLLTAPAFPSDHEQLAVAKEKSPLELPRVLLLQKLLQHRMELNTDDEEKYLRSYYSQDKFENLLDNYSGREFDASDLLDTNLTPAEYLDVIQYPEQSESNVDPLVHEQLL